MRIGILGTRGIPNYYGGFEQFAEFFAVYLAQNNYEVYVYNSSNHPYKEKTFNGANIIHCYDPENSIGTIGQFIYDFNCIMDSRKRNFDVLLQLGYTSNTIWHKLLPKNTIIVSNMDGLEWKRSKYSPTERKFLKYAEKLAIKSSDYLISDSIGIQNYLLKEYNAKSEYIAYGAELFDSPDLNILKHYNVTAFNYNMLIARFEPENNLEMILDGAALANNKTPFLVVGKHDANKFGEYLKKKFKDSAHIRFVGGIYDLEHLNNLRYHSNLYFHGHSVGGTNPSLLEAMASKALIIAHSNEFAKSILDDDAFYFSTKEDIQQYIDSIHKDKYTDKIRNCYSKIEVKFKWDVINKKYLDFLNECYKN
jgi:glycosyltransferase involved in cell wall biosynthesis